MPSSVRSATVATLDRASSRAARRVNRRPPIPPLHARAADALATPRFSSRSRRLAGAALPEAIAASDVDRARSMPKAGRSSPPTRTLAAAVPGMPAWHGKQSQSRSSCRRRPVRASRRRGESCSRDPDGRFVLRSTRTARGRPWPREAVAARRAPQPELGRATTPRIPLASPGRSPPIRRASEADPRPEPAGEPVRCGYLQRRSRNRATNRACLPVRAPLAPRDDRRARPG